MPSCVVYANGKPLSTKFGSERTLSADVPGNMVRGSGTLDIQVRIVDEKHVVISRSNTYEMRMK